MTRWATLAPRGDNYASQPVLAAFEGVATTSGSGAVAFDPNVGRGLGVGSYKFTSGASAGVACAQWFWGLQGNLGWYVRGYFNFAQLPVSSGNSRLIRILANDGSEFYARIFDNGKFQLRYTDGGATDNQVGSDSVLVVVPGVGNWYRVELFGKTAVGATDQCSLIVAGPNEVNEIVATGTGINLSDANIVQALWGWGSNPGANCQVNARDIAINNDNGGSPQNSYPGPGAVAYLLPVADSARGANWLDGAGGSSALYDAVDNLPPAGVADASSTATSQIKNANTADITGNYDAQLQTYRQAGIPDGAAIQVVQTVTIVGSSTTTDVSGAATIVSNPAQSAEDTWATGRSAAVGTYGSNWRGLFGTGQMLPQVVRGTGPVTRVGRRGVQAGTLEVAMMLLAVDYLPGQSLQPMSVSGQLRT